jgi:hypothetical protein
MRRETDLIKKHLEEQHGLVESSEDATASEEFPYYMSVAELEELHWQHHTQESSGPVHTKE